MASKKNVFIVNSLAGNGVKGKGWPRIQAEARNRLGPFTTHLTTKPGDATRITETILREGAELAVCVGGEGTLNEVDGCCILSGAQLMKNYSMIGV